MGEGSGLGLLPRTFDHLVEHGLLDRAFPRLAMSAQVFVGACADEPQYGREALRVPMESWAVNWSDLFRALRGRIDDDVYRGGTTVDAFETQREGTTVVFSDGSRRSFDLLIFADGHASLGRRGLFPESTPAYRGYVLWRGVAPVTSTMDVSRLRAAVVRISLGRNAGHAAFYLIPQGDGDGDAARALLNFGYYIPVRAEELGTWLVDRQGREHRANLGRGALAPEIEKRLRASAAAHLPRYYARLVAQTPDTLLQGMFCTQVPRHRVDRVCLIGDASTLAPPFTASGIVKVARQAFELASALRDPVDVDVALGAWDGRQTSSGDALYELALQMERELIWHVPDFATLDAETALGWWKKATTGPRRS